VPCPIGLEGVLENTVRNTHIIINNNKTLDQKPYHTNKTTKAASKSDKTTHA
jgi:hypothetical protein